MDRTGSSMSQESLLSEGTLQAVVSTIGDWDFETLLQDNDLRASDTELLLQAGPKHIPVPSPTGKVPCFSEYPGPYNFQCDIRDVTSERTKWLFSRALNKLFVNMHNKIPVQFNWNYNEEGLQIRALLAYTSEEFRELPVIQCPRHAEPNDVSNQGVSHSYHIIRADSGFAEYQEDPDSKRRSVLVPVHIPTSGTEPITLDYIFTCKNSCAVGMNRRSTTIIFTLERSTGEVIGRRILQVKICSCPKRDKEKEEKDFRERVEKNLQNPGPRKRAMSDRMGQRKSKYFAFNPHGTEVTMYCNNKRSARMARYLYGVIVCDAYKEQRKLTSSEEDTLAVCNKIMALEIGD